MKTPFRHLSPAQSHLCDVIRFLAALAVALHHTLDRLEYEPYHIQSRAFHGNLGSIGVTIFFVLSGFLIAHTVARKAAAGGYSFREYFVERAVRIYLVYLPAILVAAGVVAIVSGNLFQTADTSVTRLVINVFMLQGVEPFSVHAETFALLGPSWTLNYEFWLYMMFGLAALPLSLKRGWSPAAGVLIIIVAYLYMNLNEAVVMAGLWLAGVVTARVFQRLRIPFSAALPIVAVAFLGAVAGRLRYPDWDLGITILSYLVAFAALMLWSPEADAPETPARRSLAHWLAGYSYSLYLTHMVWLFLLGAAFDGLIDGMVARLGHLATAAVMLVPVNAGAFLFALCTEAHNDRVRRALLRRLPRAEAAPRAALIERQWDVS